jgi:flagellar L-ring protein precursor FlgH
MSKSSWIVFIVGAAFLFATTTRAQTTPNPTQQPPAQSTQASRARTAPGTVTQTPSDAAQNAASLMHKNGGSLLRATLAAQQDPSQAPIGSVSYFAVPAPEPKVLRKHDLVTIIVREVSESKTNGTTDLKRQSDLDAKIEAFVRANLEQWTLEQSIGQSVPEIKASANRNFKGEATVDRSDSLIARVTAEVVDVKPNGNLVLQARTRIKTDEEEQVLILSGTCRAEDITPDNSILSTQLFDKDVTKSHKGAVRDTTRRGLIPNLLDALRLF